MLDVIVRQAPKFECSEILEGVVAVTIGMKKKAQRTIIFFICSK